MAQAWDPGTRGQPTAVLPFHGGTRGSIIGPLCCRSYAGLMDVIVVSMMSIAGCLYASFPVAHRVEGCPARSRGTPLHSVLRLPWPTAGLSVFSAHPSARRERRDGARRVRNRRDHRGERRRVRSSSRADARDPRARRVWGSRNRPHGPRAHGEDVLRARSRCGRDVEALRARNQDHAGEGGAIRVGAPQWWTSRCLLRGRTVWKAPTPPAARHDRRISGISTLALFGRCRPQLGRHVSLAGKGAVTGELLRGCGISDWSSTAAGPFRVRS